jgi:hypothetical protein
MNKMEFLEKEKKFGWWIMWFDKAKPISYIPNYSPIKSIYY